jgi:hypothetical protein
MSKNVSQLTVLILVSQNASQLTVLVLVSQNVSQLTVLILVSQNAVSLLTVVCSSHSHVLERVLADCSHSHVQNAVSLLTMAVLLPPVQKILRMTTKTTQATMVEEPVVQPEIQNLMAILNHHSSAITVASGLAYS